MLKIEFFPRTKALLEDVHFWLWARWYFIYKAINKIFFRKYYIMMQDDMFARAGVRAEQIISIAKEDMLEKVANEEYITMVMVNGVQNKNIFGFKSSSTSENIFLYSRADIPYKIENVFICSGNYSIKVENIELIDTTIEYVNGLTYQFEIKGNIV